MDTRNVIAELRSTLVPKGSEPLVGLRLEPCCYVSTEFIDALINEFQKIIITSSLGEEISPMQRLAIMVLCDSGLSRKPIKNDI